MAFNIHEKSRTGSDGPIKIITQQSKIVDELKKQSDDFKRKKT